ncbi:pheromone-processing carboxypeptidase KEX1-like [Beta vulgaris subsp. vulgaris]|uniref:pheromone-processing carboxypeptidase KEX1-like n=1 Tax=Beta vulgaris subsp. vulgaris TaxID=3555 RepID=UPI0025474EEC|nr:pheromone-processing carboxypeptidase KEX1-like [Beta vulgaris subsp. vulgaris]
MIKKIELGQKKVSFKLRGCVSALTLAVIHNFKCRNLDYSNVSKPFISYWQDEKDLTNVVKQFEINMDFILPVKREKQKEYVKNMHKLKRNALAFCQVNLEIAQNIREEGEKLSQDSISLDDSEVFNPDFLSQIDDICKRHLEAKDSANKVDPTISLLVKRPVELEFGRIENVPDLDSGVHGVDLKEGNDEKEGEEDEKKMNADDDQHKEDDDDDDDDDGDDKDHQNYNEKRMMMLMIMVILVFKEMKTKE